MIFFALDFQWCCLAVQGSPTVTQHVVSDVSSSLLLHINVLKIDENRCKQTEIN